MELLFTIWGWMQLAGVVVAAVALVRERGEDPRFAGAKLIYRS